jgi:hypothetical protein
MKAHRLLTVLLFLSIPAAAQDSLFTEVRLVHDLDTKAFGALSGMEGHAFRAGRHWQGQPGL